MSTDRYSSPLSERYASKEMQYIFSQDMKSVSYTHLDVYKRQVMRSVSP